MTREMFTSAAGTCRHQKCCWRCDCVSENDTSRTVRLGGGGRQGVSESRNRSRFMEIEERELCEPKVNGW